MHACSSYTCKMCIGLTELRTACITLRVLSLYVNNVKGQQHELTSWLRSHQQSYRPHHVIARHVNRVPSFPVTSCSSLPAASNARSICRFQNELNLPTALDLRRPRYETFYFRGSLHDWLHGLLSDRRFLLVAVLYSVICLNVIVLLMHDTGNFVLML